jgi:hypothetical protein
MPLSLKSKHQLLLLNLRVDSYPILNSGLVPLFSFVSKVFKRNLIMSRTTIIAELTVFVTLILGIIFFCAHMWDDTPRGLIVLVVSMSLVLGYHTAQFLNRFESGE